MNTDSTPKSGTPIICIFGPTAVGKTSLLVRLFSGAAPTQIPTSFSSEWYRAARSAGLRTGEIISADSMQVYTGLDIGTAKPDDDTCAKLPHHLIGVQDPDRQYSAGDFVRDADRAVRTISMSNQLPVISGGTAFYFRNFLYGLPKAPAVDADVRDAVQAELSEHGIDPLYSELQSVDPESAERIPKSDTYRVSRAVEVHRTAGRPLSSFKLPATLRPGIEPLIIGLTRPRDELAERIGERVDLMIRAGLWTEVQNLLAGGLEPTAPGLKAIGYKEIVSALGAGIEQDVIVETIKRNTRRYAKRQITFFRSFTDAQWFSPDDESSVRKAIEIYLDRLADKR